MPLMVRDDISVHAALRVPSFRNALITFFLLLLGLQPSSAHAVQTWQQPRGFMVSFWVDPIVSTEKYPSRYAEVSAANFTTILGGFGALTADAVEAQIAAAAALNLSVVAAGAAQPYSTNPSAALWGWQLKDEPTALDFPALANETAALAAARPGKLRFVNLLPNYATATQLSGDPAGVTGMSYGEYVSSFVEQVRPDVLCVDHYPLFEVDDEVAGTNATRAGYRANLEVLREQSLGAGIPFWIFFNSMPFGNHGDPTEAQIR
jgi:hypothetical protein